MPNGGRAPGEVGALMAGAQVALTNGAEAAWYNPAGMAKESRTVFSVGGSALEVQNLSIHDGEAASTRSGPGFLSLVSGSLGRGREHRFSYGISLIWPVQHRFETRLVDLDTIGQEQLPEIFTGPADLDQLFPDGIERVETARGVGAFAVVSPGVGFGFSIAPWFRVGLSLRLERLSLKEKSDSVVIFSAEGAEGSGDSLSGTSLTAADFQGEAGRLIYKLGFQADFSRHFIAGLTVRFRSEDERGSGRVFFSRSQMLSVLRGNEPSLETEDFVLVERDDVGFELRTPRELRLGLAFVFDTLTVEFDWNRQGELGSYEVFPAEENSPASGRPFQTPSLQTSLDATNSYALGVALSAGRGGAFLFGFSQDSSGVPADDAVFRKVDFTNVSGGYFFSRGPFSTSAGLLFREGNEKAVQFPQLGGGETIRKAVRLSDFTFQLGFSYIL